MPSGTSPPSVTTTACSPLVLSLNLWQTGTSAPAAGPVPALGDDDRVLYVGLVPELLEDRDERLVHEHDLVLGVVGYKREVVLVQPGVERVEHSPRAGRPEVRLEVLVGVPAQGSDPVAVLQAQLLQGHGQLFGAGDEVGEGVAVEAFVRAAGNYLAVAVELFGAA